jgi:hypothetical protein
LKRKEKKVVTSFFRTAAKRFVEARQRQANHRVNAVLQGMGEAGNMSKGVSLENNRR